MIDLIVDFSIVVFNFTKNKIVIPFYNWFVKTNTLLSAQSGWHCGFITAIGLDLLFRSIYNNNIFAAILSFVLFALAKNAWDKNATKN